MVSGLIEINTFFFFFKRPTRISSQANDSHTTVELALAKKISGDNTTTQSQKKSLGEKKMVRTLPSSSSHLLFSTSLSSNSRLSPLHLRGHRPLSTAGAGAGAVRLRLRAVSSPATQTAESKTGGKEKEQYYQLQNLTTWLLRQEQSGVIDSELTIVLSSISLACKQIASLLQRSSIINLTGAHGTINVQGEDQKKLDVISNEVRKYYLSEMIFLRILVS